MKRQNETIACLLSVLVVGAGCGKGADSAAAVKGSAAAPATSTATSAVTSAPVSGATTPPRAAPPEAAPATVSVPTREAESANVTAPAGASAPAERSPDPSTTVIPAAMVGSGSAPAAVAAAAESPEASRKRLQIEWALKEDEIKNDPNGQWAAQASGSSAYNDAKGNAPYAASQATGTPNVESYGNNPSAWSTKTPDAGIEWLDLQYAKPVHATKVRVRESYGSGAVIKVELFDEQGASHVVWTGSDATKELNYLAVEFPKTSYKANRVKVTLATNIVHGWNAIDAVQLVGTGDPLPQKP
jgi:hypothetical protein